MLTPSAFWHLTYFQVSTNKRVASHTPLASCRHSVGSRPSVALKERRRQKRQQQHQRDTISRSPTPCRGSSSSTQRPEIEHIHLQELTTGFKQDSMPTRVAGNPLHGLLRAATPPPNLRQFSLGLALGIAGGVWRPVAARVESYLPPWQACCPAYNV